MALKEGRDYGFWDRLWPITDRFEEFCISQNICVPSYERVLKSWVMEEFNAIDPKTLTDEQAETYRYFKAMDQAEFDMMFHELYNPFRLSDRKKH